MPQILKPSIKVARQILPAEAVSSSLVAGEFSKGMPGVFRGGWEEVFPAVGSLGRSCNLNTAAHPSARAVSWHLELVECWGGSCQRAKGYF